MKTTPAPERERTFDPQKAQLAAERIKELRKGELRKGELRKGVRLERGNVSLREYAYIGHRY